MMLRAFVALVLPIELVDLLAEYADQYRIQDRNQEIRWVDPDNYHLTLEFLGDIDEQDIAPIADQLLAELDSFELTPQTIREISYFPFTSKPKVVAALLDKEASLAELHRRVEKILRRLDMTLQKQRFTPHITLGRVRARRAPRLQIPPVALNQQVQFSRLMLIESHLHPQGASYAPLVEWVLEVPAAEHGRDELVVTL